MADKRLIFLLITFIITSCTGPKVVTFTNPKANFGSYETFRIISPRGEEKTTLSDSIGLNFEIEALIKESMVEYGYRLNERSDLRVQYSFITNNKTDVNITRDFTRAPYYTPFPGAYRVYNVRSRNFYEGILLIELKNKKAKTVWQGSLNLNYTKKIENEKDVLPSAVNKIFSSYPYRAGHSKPVPSN